MGLSLLHSSLQSLRRLPPSSGMGRFNSNLVPRPHFGGGGGGGSEGGGLGTRLAQQPEEVRQGCDIVQKSHDIIAYYI